MVKPIAELAVELPIEERLELIRRLCESVEQHPVLTDEERAFVQRRLQDHQQNPSGVVSWDEARVRLRKRFG